MFRTSKFASRCVTRLFQIGFLILFAVAAFAQTDFGTIAGFVKDPSGAVIPKAQITIRNESTGIENKVVTNDAGYYTIPNLPTGLYTLSAEAAGFKKFQSIHNKLDPASVLSLDAPMQVGAVGEQVEVVASAQQLQTDSAAVQRLITREQIDALELNGRNPIFMANLVAGAHGGNLAGLSFNFSQGPSNFNGSRNPDNLITYDGAPATRTRSNGTSLGAADVDSTQEVQVLTSNYGAEYGRSSGGQIRIITKAGGQQFHGAFYEYVRNAAFNANTWTRNHTPGQNFVPVFNYNQYGFNIGGPAYIPGKFNTQKNKIFWYWGTEWVRYRFTDSSSMTVPSLLMRQGNFSELLNPTNVYYGKAVTINDPTTGSPFPGNIIPTNRLSPNGVGLMKAYPAPNLTVPINGNQNWYLTALHPQDQRKDTLAADFNITDTQRFGFRRNNFLFDEYQPLDGGSGETPKYFHRPNQTNSASYVWTISPTLINETLATASLDDVYIPVDTAHFLDRTTVGINYPYIFPTGKLIPTRIPTINLNNFSGLSGGPYPSHSSGPIYDLSDNLTWVKGKHAFKFGFMFEHQGENDNDEINVSACPTCTNNQNGQFLFSDNRPGGSGVAIGNMALGLFNTYSELGQRAYTPFRGNMSEYFAQDSWKVTEKLHIDYGVRYTVIIPYSAQWRNMIVFDPAFYDPSKAVTVSPVNGSVIVTPGSDRYNGMVIPGSGFPSSANGRFPEATSGQYNYLFRGVNPHYSDIQWGDIQPRVGVAYQIDPKTVFRTGAGRFFTRLGVSDSIFLGGNPPFQPTANVTNGSVDNPGGTTGNSLPLTVTTQSKVFKNPEAWNWNFTVERELFWKSIGSIAYVGRRGLHLQREADINQPTVATVLANPGVNLDSLRPYKGYNSIRQTDNVASSLYNSLQLTWNRRLSNGLLFGAAYTYSQSYDNGSNQRDIIPNTYYAGNLWGPSEFDARHILIINYLYNLPFFKNRSTLAGKTLGGWQISGITQFQSGTPCGVGGGGSNDYAGVGQDANWGCGNGGQLWAVNGNPAIIGGFAANGASDPHQYFATLNPDGSPIFVKPAAGTFVTQKGIRDNIYAPGFSNWNVGLFKDFAMTERIGFQFRAEAFDAFNHPNLGGPSYNPNNLSTFGKITGKTGDVRNLQLSLRFYY